MRVQPLLHNWLQDAREWCHLKRLMSLLFAMEALLTSCTLTLTGLGRAGAKGGATEKNRIKRIDRLLGNKHLPFEIDKFSVLLAKKLIGKTQQPLLLVDWTPLVCGFCALTASVPTEGRSLLLYWEVHRKRLVGNRSVQHRFLKRLSKIVPSKCSPVIVTDAGFHAPWFKAVRALGWDYLGRVRAHIKYLKDSFSWEEVRTFHPKAKIAPQDLGRFIVSKSNPIEHRLVLVRQRKKPGPKRKRITHKQKPGPSKKSVTSKGLSLTAQASKHRNSANEPWILATSLNSPAQVIVGCYKRRMQTEEAYRHLKSYRYGWAMDSGKSKSAVRLRILLLIAALTSAFLTAVGMIAENQKLQRHYQANTIKNRRVLSLLHLARFVLRDDMIQLTAMSLGYAFMDLSKITGVLL